MSDLISILRTEIPDILSRNEKVPGVSLALILNDEIIPYAAGLARSSSKEVLTVDHLMECASLSKTVGSAFAIEYFSKKSIPLTTPVNNILKDLNTSWRIALPPDSNLPADSIDLVTLAMLMNHTALGMHYVYGIPLPDGLPPVIELLNGTHEQKYGYKPLFLERIPGEEFAYSGGGFIVLQYILEEMAQQPIEEIIRPFLTSLHMQDFTFQQSNRDVITKYATGHYDTGDEVQPTEGGRLAFPPLAAGGLTTPTALAHFLSSLTRAYNNPTGYQLISHSTARNMLSSESLVDKGAISFMNAYIGHGVFVAQAGANRVMIHQAANDGFRGVYVMCFDGPDTGKGAVIITNGDNASVYMICEICRLVLGHRVLALEGIDFSQVQSKDFSMKDLPQEVIVNIGLKELVFNAFINDSNNNKIQNISRL